MHEPSESGPHAERGGSPTPNPYNPLAWFVGEPIIGAGTWIGPFCMIDGSGGLTIGSGCDIAAGAHIYTHSSARRCVTGRSVGDVERAPVIIGDRTFIGANAVVLPGVVVGSGVIVAAGAVVTRNVPDGLCVAGVPASPIGTVDPVTGDVSPFA